MDVRLARPTDAPLILSLAVDESAHLVRSPSWPAKNPVARTVTRTLFPLTFSGRMWIVQDGCSTALLEIQPRRYVIGFDVARLAVRGDPQAVLGAVLGAATAHLQSKGVPRLFARARERAGETLRAYEFQPMAREYVLIGRADDARGESELPIDSRYRISADAWPLHQLESAITPPLVRQVEGLTSVDWSKTVKDMSEVVVERDGKIVAWAGWGTKLAPKLVAISLMVEKGHSDLGSDLVQYALKQVGAGYRLVARVRDYQSEAMRAFTDLGFEIAGEEVVMLKHAGVELARVQKRRLQVSAVPSVQAFHARRLPAAGTRRPPTSLTGKKTICDGIA